MSDFHADTTFTDTDAEQEENLRIERRKKRIAEQKKLKMKQLKRRRIIKFSLLFCPVFLILATGFFSLMNKTEAHKESSDQLSANSVITENEETDLTESTLPDTTHENENTVQAQSVVSSGTVTDSTVSVKPVPKPITFTKTASTDSYLPDTVNSTYGIVIDTKTDTILAEQNARERMNPASMTKVLTLLVAAEHISDLEDTFTITQEITSYVYVNDCSAVNWGNDETVTIKDLLYGTILPSGADAALGLANYVAGSEEAFVELMNDKLRELGLSDTAHFTNCIGLYDENHYCTLYDMAVIMKAALQNDLCKEVLSTKRFTTSSTVEHPEGIAISNWFLRRIEDKETNCEVLCAKTGFVNESGSCAVSYGEDASQNGYIIVTGNAYSSWRCIYDHVELYLKYTK